MIKFTKTVKRAFMEPLTYTGEIDTISNFSIVDDIIGKMIMIYDGIGTVAAVLHDNNGDFIEVEDSIIMGAENIAHAIEIINYNSKMTDILDTLE